MNIDPGAMDEAPREEEVVVRLASGPQIISSESIGPAALGAGAAGARGAAAGAELGRRLLLAARAGDAQAVLDLMAQGAPFSTDWLGTSPLHLAAAGGHVAAAGVLLRAGVSRDARTKVERTPLHLAAHAGHARLAALLLDHGALLDCRDMLRMTPLHWACARGHAALAALLARRGADTRARCKFRRTPLQLAAPAVRQAVLTALRERAAHTEEMAVDESPVTEPKYETVQMPPPVEEKPAIKIQQKVIKPSTETESQSGGAATEPAGGAAALLRQHGITLLPVDETSTVLSALQSGRTVVLSDAGKLMLKESRCGPAGARVVLRAAPAREPPPEGGKVFALSQLPAKPLPAKPLPAKPLPAKPLPAKPPPKAESEPPQDAQQIKYVQVSEGGAAPAQARRPAGARGGVKIIMNKASFGKLIATAARAHNSGDNEPLASVSGGGEAVVCVPEQFVRSMSARYLRAQLLAAHAALHAMSQELRELRARTARRS